VFEVVLTPSGHAPVPAIAADGADVTLAWPGNADWDYLIETSADLQEWSQPEQPLSGSDGPMTWQHPRDLPKRFFRLLGSTRSLDP
jgi:hypothetical protein